MADVSNAREEMRPCYNYSDRFSTRLARLNQ